MSATFITAEIIVGYY